MAVDDKLRQHSSATSRRASVTSGSDRVDIIDYDWLAADLTDQPWHEMGNCPYPLGATSDQVTMVHQLTALFAERLRELICSFCINEKNFLKDHANLLVVDEEMHSVFLSEELMDNLHYYIARIASLYNECQFHSFEHAVHVTISMNKIISMLVNVSEVAPVIDKRRASSMLLTPVPPALSEQAVAIEATFGISSDPLLRFALLFSALIHDVAHQGVPNATLIDEEDELAILHNDISVAEQNSLQIAFSVLYNEEFAVLKGAIMPNEQKRRKFRKHVIQFVLITDISNPERMQINRSRWNEAFNDAAAYDECEQTRANQGKDKYNTAVTAANPVATERRHTVHSCSPLSSRRHTMFTSHQSKRHLETARLGIRFSVLLSGQIVEAYANNDEGQQLLRRDAVSELLMNVADVAHTMQGFSVFLKWNQRLYKELFEAYHAGRLSTDPTEGWYQNQINFFVNYITPLAERIDKCGVFGSKSTIFLYFAMENKRKWIEEGQHITSKMIEEVGKALLREYQHHTENEDDENSKRESITED